MALAGEDVWWEGLSPPPAAGVPVSSWLRRAWSAGAGGPAAHPNSRFTAHAAQVPTIDEAWQDPRGVPIEAIIFGGRRDDTVPLVFETRSWVDGVFAAATLASKTTAAAEAAVGALREDPMSMRPFIGCSVSKYLTHWLDAPRLQRAAAASALVALPPLPRIFQVNWFRKGADGRFLWPGFGDNARVLDWVLARAAGEGAAVETPIGAVPAPGALVTTGLTLAPGALECALAVDAREWAAELERARAFLEEVGAPRALLDVRAALAARVAAALADSAAAGAAGE